MSDSGFNRRRMLGAAAALAAGTRTLKAAYVDELEQPHGSITDAGGIRVGHFTDDRKPTGCTVVLFERGATAGVDVRGSAPGTRETDLLNPINTVQEVNAIVLSGGSAFGLETANGVMRWLEERGRGYRVGPFVVPIVPAAILFDLQIGDPKIRPNERSGYAACEAASNAFVAEGNVGAGAGATVGKLFGLQSAMKSGIGTASIRIGETGLVVGAIVAVNALGDVRSHRSGRILAGAHAGNGQFLDSMAQIAAGGGRKHEESNGAGANTTIGVVVTNATLSKLEMTKVAQMAHDGYARTINPVHTSMDGDAIFAAATGSSPARTDVTTIGAVAAEAVAKAVNRAVITATSIQGYPAYRDMQK